jgi:hypothetical protein
VLQVKSHEAPLQLGAAFAGVLQEAHWPWHSSRPGLHSKLQLEPLHTGIALAGVLHGAHPPPQSRKPLLQLETPHWPPEQIGVPPAEEHGVQLVPQEFTEVSERQLMPQR